MSFNHLSYQRILLQSPAFLLVFPKHGKKTMSSRIKSGVLNPEKSRESIGVTSGQVGNWGGGVWLKKLEAPDDSAY